MHKNKPYKPIPEASHVGSHTQIDVQESGSFLKYPQQPLNFCRAKLSFVLSLAALHGLTLDDVLPFPLEPLGASNSKIKQRDYEIIQDFII